LSGGQWRPESLSVLARTRAEAALEGAPHHLGAGEAAAGRNDLERRRVRLEDAAGALDAQLLDPVGGRRADLAAEHPRELPLGEMDAAGERRHGEILVEVLADPALELAD